MACAASSNLCATCETLAARQKPKSGILPCIGCQKYFCSQHIIQHRQHLADLLENNVVHERNALQAKISTLYDQQWPANIKAHLETINKWELDATELIKQSAECARKQIEEMSLNKRDNIKRKFDILCGELNSLRENESYFENDIENLINKLKQLEHDIEHFPVQLIINEMSRELIVVKSIVQSTDSPTPTFYFVDRLIETQKPTRTFDVSHIETGRMYPISDQLISFYIKKGLPTLNIREDSWQSRYIGHDAAELHWSEPLQRFLVLEYSSRNNRPNILYQVDPDSGASTEIFKKSPHWNSGWPGNFKTLTCFKEHVSIVLNNAIEKWLANHIDWHTNDESTIYWRPPISCQPREEIKCIQMNDLYYALIIKNDDYSRSPSISRSRFELRNHGMSILRRLEKNDFMSPRIMRLFSLPNECGWLLFCYGKNAYYCYAFDNDAKQYDQNLVIASNITDIAVRNNMIFLPREEEGSNNDVLEIYDWQI